MTQVADAAHMVCVEATFRPRCAPVGDQLWDPTPSWSNPSGEITEYGIEVFTAGDCWALAWHTWRQLTTPQGFKSRSGPRHEMRPSLDARLCVVGTWPAWTHVLVEIDTGLFLDATGICTYDDLAAVWGAEPLSQLPADVTTDLMTYRRALGGIFEPYDFVYPITHGQTAEIADLLIRSHLGGTDTETHLRLSAPEERMAA